MKKISALWIDDQIEKYEDVTKGLANYGIEITKASSVDEGKNILLSDKAFDLILLDLKMKSGNGFTLLKEKIDIPILVLSSYLHLPEYTKRLMRTKQTIATMDKGFPSSESPGFAMFAQNIREIAENPPKVPPSKYNQNLRGTLDPFNLTYREYLRLPNRLKRHLSKEVYESCQNLIESSFKDGKVWVLICGDDEEIELSADRLSEIPSSEVILNKAIELDRAPFQFSAPDSIDDMWSGDCSGIGDAANYPTVSLEFQSDDQHHIHFDTGSHITFLSYELLNEVYSINVSGLEVNGSRGGRGYVYINCPVNAKLVDQSKKSSSKKAVKMSTRLVKGWEASPYAGKCPPTCKNFVNGEAALCKNRNGLIGRNLATENNLQITICGVSNRTSFKGQRQK